MKLLLNCDIKMILILISVCVQVTAHSVVKKSKMELLMKVFTLERKMAMLEQSIQSCNGSCNGWRQQGQFVMCQCSVGIELTVEVSCRYSIVCFV